MLWVLVTVLIMAILKCLSHARDVYGKSQTLGTCGLLDLSSTDNLVRRFQCLYGATDLYELKGLQITKYDVVISSNVREVLKRYQVNTSVKKTLFCSSSIFYLT